MREFFIILLSIFYATISKAQDGFIINPIDYENTRDVFLKFPPDLQNSFLQIKETKQKFDIKSNEMLIENLDLNTDYTFIVNIDTGGGYFQFELTTKPESNDVLDLDFGLYAAVTKWSTTDNQQVKLSDYLVELFKNSNINEEEILYYVQKILETDFKFSKNTSLAQNIKNAFSYNKDTRGPKNGCECKSLRHYADMTPRRPNAGNGNNGWNFLDNNNRFSQVIRKDFLHESNSTKWHKWHTYEKGPAHEMFLRQYDAWGSFNYEWSTFGHDNTGRLAPSPNNAFLMFNLQCVETDFELPDKCDCTKNLNVFFRYDTNLKVIARKLKPISKVHSVAQELALVTVSNMKTGEVNLLDADQAKLETKCNGSFNFEFIRNFLELTKEALELAIAIQDTTTGTILEDIAGSIDGIADELEDIFTTSPIITTGDCTDKVAEATLVSGFRTLELKANQPLLVTMSSFTFLGTYGRRKWDNYAITRSNFWLQGFLDSGSKEGNDYCCTDKVTNFLQASVNGPKSETDLLSWIEAWTRIFGPWDNFVQIGYAPVIDQRANRGYYVYNDPNRDCLPASPNKPIADDESFMKLLNNEVVTNNLNGENSKLETTDTKAIEKSFVSDFGKELQFNLYPNPTNQYINIELSNLKEGNLEVSIYNINGQKVVDIHNGVNTTSSFKTKWDDISNSLSTGTYFVVVKLNNEVLQSKPLLINK